MHRLQFPYTHHVGLRILLGEKKAFSFNGSVLRVILFRPLQTSAPAWGFQGRAVTRPRVL